MATPTCFESTDTSKMWSRIFEVKVLDGTHLGTVSQCSPGENRCMSDAQPCVV